MGTAKKLRAVSKKGKVNLLLSLLRILLVLASACSIGVASDHRGVAGDHVDGAEVDRVPVLGWHQIVALGVDQWHDCHAHLSVGQVHAASAAVVVERNGQVVIVGETRRVAGGLQLGHGPAVINGDLFDDALLLLGIADLVTDFV